MRQHWKCETARNRIELLTLPTLAPRGGLVFMAVDIPPTLSGEPKLAS
jgi:hypothetical protein